MSSSHLIQMGTATIFTAAFHSQIQTPINSTPSVGDGTSENIVGDDGDVNISAIITGTASLALDVSMDEGRDSEEVQVASAASKFLREMKDLRELRHGGKVATAADDAAQSVYSTFKDDADYTA